MKNTTASTKCRDAWKRWGAFLYKISYGRHMVHIVHNDLLNKTGFWAKLYKFLGRTVLFEPHLPSYTILL